MSYSVKYTIGGKTNIAPTEYDTYDKALALAQHFKKIFGDAVLLVDLNDNKPKEETMSYSIQYTIDNETQTTERYPYEGHGKAVAHAELFKQKYGNALLQIDLVNGV